MFEIALLENCDDNANFFADMYETITRQFCFPEWIAKDCLESCAKALYVTERSFLYEKTRKRLRLQVLH